MSQTKAQLLNPLGDLDLTGQLTGVGATFTGNITAVDGIFSGNVSVAGTLTKQDVTNVDSVGVVTARSGVNISGGNLQFGGTNVINSGLALYNLDSIKLADGKELKLGSSDDLKIYHNGSHSYINENGNGALKVKGDDIRFENQAGAERLRIGTGGANSSIGINTTLNMVTNSEVLAVYGTSSFKSHTETRPPLYLGNEGAVDDTANPLVLFNQGGANRGGIGYVPNTGELRFNNQYFHTFTTGASTLGGTERLRIHADGEVEIKGGAAGQNALLVSANYAGGANVDIQTWQRIGGAVQAKMTYKDATTSMHFGSDTAHSLSLMTGGTDRLTLNNSGAIGIAGANYGNAGQVLTSGGSGSAISWADAAGGATYAGISSGAMSAGDPVVVRDDGKLEKVGYSWNESIATGSVAEKNGINIPSAGVWASWARNDDGTTWEGSGDRNRVLFLFRNSNSPSYITGTYDGNNMTLNSMSGWNDGDNVAIFDAAYNSNGKRFAVAYRHGGNGRIRVNSGRPGGTTVTWGTTSNNGRPEINSSSSSNAVGIEYAGNDKFMVVYGEGNKIFAQVVTNSSNNNYMELSAGTRTEIEDVGAAASYKLTVSKPDSNGRMLMFYRKALGGDFGLKMAILTISGTDVSYNGRAWVSSTNPVVLQTPLSAISYDPNEDRYLLTYERTSDNRLYGRNMKIVSAGTISMSAETQLSTQNPYEGQGTVYDTNLKKHFVYFTDASTNKLSYVPVTFTGDSAPTAGTLGVIYNTAHRMRSFTIDYDATLGKVVTGARNEDSGPNFLAGLINQTASSTTNLGENNFLGFSKGSYTDGNTAKIGTLSAVDENQTGLTTTTHYYVQPDGTLSTTAATPRVTAGKAVSSTNLIVKSDNDPRPGSLGHWTYSLSGGVFKPWCACGYGSNSGGIIGAYECANSSCRYCTGCWQPYCCVQGQEYWNYDLPTESGGNMCLGCGGCDCDSGYNITRACCCCWPTGRFWFPEVGIYCYNLNMILSSCMGAPPSGGCWSALAYYTVPKCRNRSCCNVFCGINGYHAYTTAACGYCEPRQAFDNVHIDGIVGVADTTKNFMAFGISKASMTNCVIVQNGVTLRGDGCTGRYPNYVSFQKISNCPQITYCN